MGRGGARARCCTAHKVIDRIVPTSIFPDLAHYLREFIRNPACPARLKLRLSTVSESSPMENGNLDNARSGPYPRSGSTLPDLSPSGVFYRFLFMIISGSSAISVAEAWIWNQEIGKKWDGFHLDYLSKYVPEWSGFDQFGAEEVAFKVTCAPDLYELQLEDDLAGGHLPSKAITCECKTSCIMPPYDDGGKDELDTGMPGESVTAVNVEAIWSDALVPPIGLVPPPTLGNRRIYEFTVLDPNGTEHTFDFRRSAVSRSTNSPDGEWRPWHVAVTWNDRRNCDDATLGLNWDPTTYDHEGIDSKSIYGHRRRP